MEVLYNVILLTPNNHLQKAMRLYENDVIGPESILVDGGTVHNVNTAMQYTAIFHGCKNGKLSLFS